MDRPERAERVTGTAAARVDDDAPAHVDEVEQLLRIRDLHPDEAVRRVRADRRRVVGPVDADPGGVEVDRPGAQQVVRTGRDQTSARLGMRLAPVLTSSRLALMGVGVNQERLESPADLSR